MSNLIGKSILGAWHTADRQLDRMDMVRDAISAVSPYGDHLARWLAKEVSEHPLADREWINGVLKAAIAEQYPSIPMAVLDESLPSGRIFE